MYPNLKLQLWKAGIRQNRLAQILGIDESILSRIVNGFREPSEDLRLQIADALACDAVWLFEPMGKRDDRPPRTEAHRFDSRNRTGSHT